MSKKRKRNSRNRIYMTAGKGLGAMALLTGASLFIIGASRPGGYLGEPLPISEEASSDSAELIAASTGITTLVGEEYREGSEQELENESTPVDGISSVPETAVTEEEEPTYMKTAMGEMIYYTQIDERWGEYLWGGVDPMNVYGCGPTAMAMLVESFGNAEDTVTPVTMAEWTEANGQHSHGEGSNHSIVETTLSSFGLQVRTMQNTMTEEAVRAEIAQGHVLVALVGDGYFTENGHFLLILGDNPDGTINVADPVSTEHTEEKYDLSFLLSELKTESTDYGSPLWSVSKADA